MRHRLLILINYYQWGVATDYPERNFSPGAKWIRDITTGRIEQFHGGRYSDFNLSSVLVTHQLDDVDHVQLQRWSAPALTKPTFKEALEHEFQPAKKGESIGPSCN
jgi:alpha-mannosidase